MDERYNRWYSLLDEFRGISAELGSEPKNTSRFKRLNSLLRKLLNDIQHEYNLLLKQGHYVKCPHFKRSSRSLKLEYCEVCYKALAVKG
jgi:hypothetical protein